MDQIIKARVFNQVLEHSLHCSAVPAKFNSCTTSYYCKLLFKKNPYGTLLRFVTGMGKVGEMQ